MSPAYRSHNTYVHDTTFGLFSSVTTVVLVISIDIVSWWQLHEIRTYILTNNSYSFASDTWNYYRNNCIILEHVNCLHRMACNYYSQGSSKKMCCLLSLTLFVTLFLAQEMNIIMESLMHIAVFICDCVYLLLCLSIIMKAVMYDTKNRSVKRQHTRTKLKTSYFKLFLWVLLKWPIAKLMSKQWSNFGSTRKWRISQFIVKYRIRIIIPRNWCTCRKCPGQQFRSNTPLRAEQWTYLLNFANVDTIIFPIERVHDSPQGS